MSKGPAKLAHLEAFFTFVAACLFLVAGSSCLRAGAETVPTAIRTVIVSTDYALGNALDAALPGDHIVLANGSYHGFSIASSGQSGKPIVIRAADILQARVSGEVTIDGDYIWVLGMDMASYPIVINGQDDRVSRNRFRRADHPILATDTSRRAEIDHNEIDQGNTGGEGDRRGIRLNYKTESGDLVYNHHVHHNFLHGAAGSDNNGIVSSENGNQREFQAGTVIEYNLIMDWPGGRQIGVKSGGNIIRFNTSINAGSEEYVNRTGVNNQWIANWSDGARIRINDRDNIAIGNVSRVVLFGGNQTAADADANGLATGYIPAENTLVAGNTGMLRLGPVFPGYGGEPIRNTKIEAHQGPIEHLRDSGTSISTSTSRTIPQAFRLSPAEVGPFAPTAPKP
jgi:hypothetical protein